MVDVTFIGSATGAAINGANATINVGGVSGIQDGDYLVVFSGSYYRASGDAAPTTDGSGSFSEKINQVSNSLRIGRCNCKFRSGDTTITIAGTGNTSDAVAGTCLVFRNVDISTPDDATPQYANGTGAPNAPSITTNTAGAMVVIGASSIRDTSVGTCANITNTLVTVNSATETNGETVSSGYQLQASPGALDAGAWSSWSSSNNVAMTIALKPTAIIPLIANGIATAGAFVGGVGYAPPSFTSSTATAFNTGTTPKDTASIAVQNGDVLVASGMCESAYILGNITIDITTQSGSTSGWSLQEETPYIGSNTHCFLRTWTATATASGNITVRFTKTGDVGARFGGVVKVWHGSDGIGNVNHGDNDTGTGQPTVGVTTTQDYSALDFSDCDWAAQAGTVTFTASDGTPVQDVADQTTAGANYCIYSSHVVDAGVAGSKTMGMSSPNAQRYICTVVEVLGTAGISGPELTINGGADVDLAANGIATAGASLGTPAISQQHVLTANGIATAGASLASPTFTQKHALTANGIATAGASLGTPGLSINESGHWNLTANGIATAGASLGSPAIGQNHKLTANPLATAGASLGSPVMVRKVALVASPLATGAAFLDQPAFTQKHVLVGAALATGPPSLGTPAISQNHALTATPLATAGASLGTPALSQNHKLTANTLATAGAALGTPAIGQKHVLTAAPLATAGASLGHPLLTVNGAMPSFTADPLVTAGASLGTPALTQRHVLTAAPLATAGASLGTPALTISRVLTASPLATRAASLGTPALTQKHVLTAAPLATKGAALGTPVITQRHVLVANPFSTAGAGLGTPVFHQTHALTAIGIATKAASLGQPAFGQRHTLTADSLATAGAVLGPATLSQKWSLTATGIATASAFLGEPAFYAWEQISHNVLYADDLATAAAYLGHPALTQQTPTARPGHRMRRSVQRVRELINIHGRERLIERASYRTRTLMRH